jgi:hypothetical protein
MLRRTKLIGVNGQVHFRRELCGPLAFRFDFNDILTTAAFVVLTAPVTAPQLSAQGVGSHSAPTPFPFLDSLSRYEQRATNPPGELEYATVLVRLTASHLSQNDSSLLAERLARANQEARHDDTKLIPEAAVVEAFNAWMAQVQGSYSISSRTDAQSVHGMREVLAANSSDLTSVRTHHGSCLPDEAMLLTFLLERNNGRVVVVPRGQPALAHMGVSMSMTDAGDNADSRMQQYLAAHSPRKDMSLFRRMFADMGIRN